VNEEPNAQPIANAGEDQELTIVHDGNPETHTIDVQLCASESTDPDGDEISFYWNTGDTTVCIDESLEAGLHNFIISVSDSYGVVDTDEVEVTINEEPNLQPLAEAGEDITTDILHDCNIETNTTQVEICGTDSSDPDEDEISFSWSSGQSTTCIVEELSAGEFLYTLTITDPYGASDNDFILITVNAESNNMPVVELESSTIEDTISLDCDSTTDEVLINLEGLGEDLDNDPLDYWWVNNTTGETLPDSTQITSTSLGVGEYNFSFHVEDCYGAQAFEQVTVIVNPEPNQTPEISFINMVDSLYIPHNCQETDSISIEISADILDDCGSYDSYWVDTTGDTAGTGNLIQEELDAGDYNYLVCATDNYGLESCEEIYFTIYPESNIAPTAVIDSSLILTTIPPDCEPLTDEVIINLEGIADDIENDPLDYWWVNNTTGETLPDSTQITSTSLGVGEYDFSFHVEDCYGDQDYDQVTINVNPEPNLSPIVTILPIDSLYIPHNCYDQNEINVSLSGEVEDDCEEFFTFWLSANGDTVETAETYNLTLEAGEHNYQFCAVDNFDQMSCELINFNITPESNTPPEAEIIEDTLQFVVDHDCDADTDWHGITLQGFANDEDGDPLEYWWVNNTTGETLPDSSLIINTNLSVGTYEFKFYVQDCFGALVYDQITVMINPELNTTPTAEVIAETDYFIPSDCDPLNNEMEINLIAEVNDNEQDPLVYWWSSADTSFIDSSLVVSPFLGTGTYNYYFYVQDCYGAVDVQEINFTVHPPEDPDITVSIDPVGDFYLNHDCGESSTAVVHLTGHVDGICPYVSWWWYDDENNYFTEDDSYTVNLPIGEYTFNFAAENSNDLFAWDTVMFSVLPAQNEIPVADAGLDTIFTIPHDCNIETNTTEITICGSNSFDPDEVDELYFAWDTGDSTECITEELPTGIYPHTLTVTDCYDAQNSDEIIVTVNPEPNQVPIAVIADTLFVSIFQDNFAAIEIDGGQSHDPDEIYCDEFLEYNWTINLDGNLINLAGQIVYLDSLTVGYYDGSLVVNDPYFESSDPQNFTISVLDCNLQPEGEARYDACLMCSGGETGVEPPVELDDGTWEGDNIDCYGICHPETPIGQLQIQEGFEYGAYHDACGICSGGSSPHDINYGNCYDHPEIECTQFPVDSCEELNDRCYVYGNDENVDCAGYCFGTEDAPIIEAVNQEFIPTYPDSVTISFSKPMDFNSFSGINAAALIAGEIGITISNVDPEQSQFVIKYHDFLASLDSLFITIPGTVRSLDSCFVLETQISIPSLLMGDFNFNNQIDYDDILGHFLPAWNQNFLYETGPVLNFGSVPHLIVHPDQIFDIEDLMSLGEMWRWQQQLQHFSGRNISRSTDGNLSIKNNKLGLMINRLTDSISGIQLRITTHIHPLDFNFNSALDFDLFFNYEYPDSHSVEYIMGAINPILIDDDIVFGTFNNHHNQEISVEYSIYNDHGEIISDGHDIFTIAALPDAFALEPVYPNPVNSSAVISFQLPEKTGVYLKLIDIKGRAVAVLIDTELESGYHKFNLELSDYSSGLYFVQMTAEKYSKNQKFILLK
ncbi:MAG: hypothetical protein CMA77_01975, partial [Euryarchaeota archaeon]|nr:hypothetical protein [Euryarchaeota archaeon]